MDKPGIIKVPAFDRDYYVVGRPIEYIKLATENVRLNGVIQTVEHQQLKIVAVDSSGQIVEIDVNLFDVIKGRVRFNYTPPIGWDSPFNP